MTELHVLQHIVTLLVWVWLIEGILSPCYLLDTLAHLHRIVRSILLVRFFLWQVSIIYSICEACTCKQILQTFLLIFHQGVEWIEEQSLYLIRHGMLLQVMHQWHHETLCLTRTCTCGYNDRHWLLLASNLYCLVQQSIPTLVLVLVWRIRKSPQSAYKRLCRFCRYAMNCLI